MPTGKATPGGTDNPSGFAPHVAPSEVLPEFTTLPVLVGIVLGMVFGASSLYLVLKVGLTVSASIPVAVISITLFRIFGRLGVRNATILENNIVQTAGSAGESIAFGLGVTMPAILILGFDLEITRVTLVAVLGGLLGILMMIPLRRALIVKQHGVLKYPEGTACAEVLKAGAESTERRGDRENGNQRGARTILAGFGVGLAYKFLMAALKGWKEIPERIFGAPFKAGSISAEISPELLGVGYIIGPKLGAIMCGGGVLAYLVLIPAIKFFGEGLSAPLAPGTVPIREMGPEEIRGAYILYIGAGAVAAGGIISLFRSLPIIWHGIREGLGMIRGMPGQGSAAPRTERDLSFKFVAGGIVALLIAIVLARPLHMNILGALLIVVFGFLFATVSSRLTGEIGSSSNPISGMTVATLLLTCLVFLVLGWTSPGYYITALSVGGIVCIAASNAGTTSQDLKTGFLLGATPRLQQIAILLGALASALVLGPILLRLNAAASVYVPALTCEEITHRDRALSPEQTEALPPFDMARLRGGSPLGSMTNRMVRFLKVEQVRKTEEGISLLPGEYLVADNGSWVGRLRHSFNEGLRAPPGSLGGIERLTGSQSSHDPATYRVWQKADDEGGPAGKYLVNESGQVVYLVDPGINGTHKRRPDGTTVTKFDAPKATLMSYIIKGILSRELPWGLVLVGVMISVVLEMAGIASLAFAVGVYLPLSSSSPIFVGGMIRWLADWHLGRRQAGKGLSPADLAAETDRGSGVLMASGYIAGGAIAGIGIAFMEGLLGDASQRIRDWSEAHNPMFAGPHADLLSLLPFAMLALVLYFSGRRASEPTRADVRR